MALSVHRRPRPARSAVQDQRGALPQQLRGAQESPCRQVLPRRRRPPAHARCRARPERARPQSASGPACHLSARSRRVPLREHGVEPLRRGFEPGLGLGIGRLTLLSERECFVDSLGRQLIELAHAGREGLVERIEALGVGDSAHGVLHLGDDRSIRPVRPIIKLRQGGTAGVRVFLARYALESDCAASGRLATSPP